MPMDPEVSKALADLKATTNSVFLDRQRSEEEYKDLIKAAEKAKLIQHKAAIKATKLEHKSASSKRAVSAYLKFHWPLMQPPQIGYLMQSKHHLEDFDAIWEKITKMAESNEGKVATAENFAEVNIAIAKQAE